MIAGSLPSSHYYPQKMAFSLPCCGVVKQWLHTQSSHPVECICQHAVACISQVSQCSAGECYIVCVCVCVCARACVRKCIHVCVCVHSVYFYQFTLEKEDCTGVVVNSLFAVVTKMFIQNSICVMYSHTFNTLITNWDLRFILLFPGNV